MRLLIARHGLAGEHGDPRYPDDNERPLTAEGRQRFGDTVKWLAKQGLKPEIVATSPLVRCRQTAELLARHVETAPPVIELPALAPGSDLRAVLNWTAQQSCDQLAWVGHAPDVSLMAAALLGSRSASLRFPKGAIAAIEFADGVERNEGQLLWLVTAKILGC